MSTPLSYYESKIHYYTQIILTLKKKTTVIAVFRLISFICLLIAAYLLSSDFSLSLLIASSLIAVIFIILVRVSFNLNAERKLSEKFLFINKNEHSILTRGDNLFPSNPGMDQLAMYADDLDIFGERSLFHLLNRTTTVHGSEYLASTLNQTLTDNEAIVVRQSAVQQLSTQSDHRQMLTARGLLHNEKEGNLNDIVQWIEDPQSAEQRSWLASARFVLPAFNIAALIFYLYTDNSFPLAIGVFFSWLITGKYAKYILQQHNLTGKKQSILEQYASILKYFTCLEAGQSSLLTALRDQAAGAHREILNLSRLSSLFDQRLNLLVYVLLNSFFLYDIQCIFALNAWKRRNKLNFRRWIDCVGSIETLNSLATFAFNNPQYCFPEIRSGKPIIAAKDMSHPLIPGTVHVANDLNIGEEENLLVITGSNMSGKSTFLRTIGVNLLLAQCGAPVSANSFAFTPLKILSAIRISDSLQEHTSYFMAELKRLHDIITQLATGEPALILIDEVLRGTNSDDKTHGSEAFIKKLLRYECLALFATHDLNLSALEEQHPGQISNYCFESTIRNGELYFDYKLHKGVAKNKNASFLMEKMGII